MALCTASTKKGAKCGGSAVGDTELCRWHAPNRNGKSMVVLSAESLATDPAVAALDLSTPAGLKLLLAITLKALTKLPLDVRLANAMGFLATSQRSIIEQSEIVARIEALENAPPPKATP